MFSERLRSGIILDGHRVSKVSTVKAKSPREVVGCLAPVQGRASRRGSEAFSAAVAITVEKRRKESTS